MVVMIEMLVSSVFPMLLMHLVTVCASFPLSELLGSDNNYLLLSRVHTYRGGNLLLRAYISSPLYRLNVHPEVTIFRHDPDYPFEWDYGISFVMRVDRTTKNVIWANAFPPGYISYVSGSCLDSRGNFYTISTLRQVVGGYSVNLLKFSSDGKFLWDARLNHPVLNKKPNYIYNMECPANNRITVAAIINSVNTIFTMDSSSGNVTSTVLLDGGHKNFYKSFPHVSTYGEATCSHAQRIGPVSVKRRGLLYFYCAHKKGGKVIVNNRMLPIEPRLIRDHEKVKIVVGPKEEWASCQPVYVMYRFGPENPNDTKFPNLIILRKLCVDTLEDTPWTPGGDPYIRNFTLPDLTRGIKPRYLTYLRGSNGVAVVFRVYAVRGPERYEVPSGARTLAPGSWLGFYGANSTKPVFAKPFAQKEIYGQTFTPWRAYFEYADIALTRDESKIIVFGKWYFTRRNYSERPTAILTIPVRIPISTVT